MEFLSGDFESSILSSSSCLSSGSCSCPNDSSLCTEMSWSGSP